MDRRNPPPGYPDLAEVARRIGISGVVKCLIYNLRQKAETASLSGRTSNEIMQIWKIVDQLDWVLVDLQDSRRIQRQELELSRLARQKLVASGVDIEQASHGEDCRCAACASRLSQRNLW